jgi:hypothetical protein
MPRFFFPFWCGRIMRSSIAAPLRIAENEHVGRVTAFCSHQRDLCCFQKWFAVLADAAGQVRIPRREFSLGIAQAAFAKGFFD